jgi:two-component system NtrC family sensor kinase
MSEIENHRRHNLLVVEDSETQAILIRRMLESHGFHVERAASAEAALDHLNTRLPDLIIADFHLPGMSGGELSRQLRLNARTRSIPLLMLTQAAEAETEREGLESGADAYVSKGADPDFMILRIRALLRQRPSPQEEPGGETPHFRRVRFLLIDDDAAARAEHRAALEREGYRVRIADDGAAAARIIAEAKEAVDCIIIGLPATRFDSIETCRSLSALRTGGGGDGDGDGGEHGLAPFLLVGLERGGTVPKERLSRAFEAGLDEFIPQLGDGMLLRARLRAIVRRKLMLDELQAAAAERRDHAITAERARMAEALTTANAELEAANGKLIEAQARLVQAAKMASLGELVAGIAHEINNPLAFILAHQTTVERELAKIPPDALAEERARRGIAKARERARAMGAGLARIRDLVRNLRQFSRMEEGGFQRVDVREAIDTIVTLLGPKLGDRVVIYRHYNAPPTLWCSPSLFNQVVMNIVSNAADAIEGPGRINIALSLQGDAYVITIDDSGNGVAPELKERIFEPFFTTKPIGTGTGLGLAIAYTVVKAHGGTITIGTAPLGGASFRIAVPAAPAGAAEWTGQAAVAATLGAEAGRE